MKVKKIISIIISIISIIISMVTLISCNKDKELPTPIHTKKTNIVTTQPFILIDSIKGKWQIYKEYHYNNTDNIEVYPNNPIVLIFDSTIVQYDIPAQPTQLTVQDSLINSIHFKYKLLDIDLSNNWMLVEDVNGSSIAPYTKLKLSFGRIK